MKIRNKFYKNQNASRLKGSAFWLFSSNHNVICPFKGLDLAPPRMLSGLLSACADKRPGRTAFLNFSEQ